MKNGFWGKTIAIFAKMLANCWRKIEFILYKKSVMKTKMKFNVNLHLHTSISKKQTF